MPVPNKAEKNKILVIWNRKLFYEANLQDDKKCRACQRRQYRKDHPPRTDS